MRYIVSDPASPTSPASNAPPVAIEARIKIEIREIGIPPRPSILVRIEEETAKDDPDFIQLGRILSQDVGLSASLIKVANSPYFSFGKTVPTVQEALLVLGLKLVLTTVAGLALQQVFKHVANMDRFWDASASNAQAANWLARKIGQKSGIRPEDAYTFSLFRDCGIPVLLVPFPDYQSTLDAAHAEPTLSFTEVEDQAMGINHAQVGAEMAETWRLPADICVGIRHHHDKLALAPAHADITERSQTLIAISHLAEYLVQPKKGGAPSCEWKKLGTACSAALGIDDEELGALSEAFVATSAST